MAIPQSVTDALAQLDAETTAVGVYVEGLRDLVKTGMTAAEVNTVATGMTAVADRLKGLAHDPQNPVDPTPLPPVVQGKKSKHP